MTRFKISSILLVLAGSFCALPGRSADVSSTGAQFLKIPVGVRSAGMGDTFAAVSDDASAPFWNTAGLAQIEKPEIQLFHASLYQSLNYEFAGIVIPLRPGTTAGLAGALNHTPAFNSTNNPSAVLGEASDLAFSVGIARQFGPCLSVGLGGKFLQSKLMTSSANGMGFDGGLLLTTKNKRFSLGLSAQNVGEMGTFSSQTAREKLPASYRAGLAGRFWTQKKLRPLLSVEIEKTLDEDPVFHGGAEFWVGSQEKCIAFRAGYQSNKLTRDLGGSIGAAFGTGVRFRSLQFDYAFVPFGLLGDTQRFSMSYRFGGRSPMLDVAPSKTMDVAVKSQLEDAKKASIKSATFDLKPQARTDIKNWALDITDSKGNILKSYSGKGVPPRSLTWDGKDEQGNVVTGGLFSTYNMRTIDRRGQQVIASEPIFKVQSSDVAIEGVDQRVLALHPEALASLGVRAPMASTTHEPPVIPQTLQPVGDLGVIKVPGLSFVTRGADLRTGFTRYLDQVAALIRKYPTAKVYIEGHAYDEGPETENVSLSQRRADTVLRYLVEVGKVAPDQLYARGHGSSAPLDVGKAEASRARNRRVDIVILTK